MEATRVLACAALAAVAGYAGMGALDAEAPGIQAVLGRLGRWLVRIARSAGQLAPCMAALDVPCVGGACDGLMARCATRGLVASRQDCCGALACLWALLAVVCGLLARSLVGCLVPLVAVPVALPMWDSARQRRRARDLASEMPGVFRTLAMALGSGETLSQAVEYVGTHGEGLSGQAFRTAALRLRCGMSAQEALGRLVGELDAPGVGLLATALLISQRTGCPLRGLFQHSAELVERQGEFERMLEVKTAQVRLSARIVSLLPAIMVGTLSLISPDFQRGLATLPGMASLVVATAMDLLALGIIRHLMRGVL